MRSGTDTSRGTLFVLEIMIVVGWNMSNDEACIGHHGEMVGGTGTIGRPTPMYEYIVKAAAEGLARLAVFLFIVGIVLGAIVMWLLPNVWQWIRSFV